MKRDKWEFLVERKYLPFSISLNGYLNSKKELDKITPFQIKDAFLYAHDELYVPKDSTKTVVHEAEKQGQPFLRNIAGLCSKRGAGLMSEIEQCANGNFSALDTNELAALFLRVYGAYKKFVIFLYL